MPIIIDGYNLLHSIQKTSEEAGSITDFYLCQTLGRYFKLIGENAEIIFDGIGPPEKERLENVSGLEVIFVGRNTDADTVIEDKIRSNTAPKMLTIVTNDRQIKDVGRLRRTSLVKCEKFWADVQQNLSKKRAVKEPKGKRSGLSNAETEQWLEIFGMDEDAD